MRYYKIESSFYVMADMIYRIDGKKVHFWDGRCWTISDVSVSYVEKCREMLEEEVFLEIL